jgi:hypothetical protein
MQYPNAAYFGPFEIYQKDTQHIDAGMIVKWPNLAILLTEAKDALKEKEPKS